MAVLSARHPEFLHLGARLFGLSADTPGQNAAVMEKLGLSFPILSDRDRSAAITPLGFADADHPRRISLPGVVVLSPEGEEVFRHTGRDYADRPDEQLLLDAVARLGLPPTSQEPPAVGPAEPGDNALTVPGLLPYMRGVKFAVQALRNRHRGLGGEFPADTKAYLAMVDRYLEALGRVHTGH